MKKRELVKIIVEQLDDYGALDLHNVPLEEIENMILEKMKDYIIIKGEILE